MTVFILSPNYMQWACSFLFLLVEVGIIIHWIYYPLIQVVLEGPRLCFFLTPHWSKSSFGNFHPCGVSRLDQSKHYDVSQLEIAHEEVTGGENIKFTLLFFSLGVCDEVLVHFKQS